MDEEQQTRHGHPVMAGAAAAIGLATLEALAYAYMLRAQGKNDADAFLRRMHKSMLTSLLIPAAALVIACFVSYASLQAAIWLLIAGLAGGLIFLVSPLTLMSGYAAKQARYLGQSRHYLHK